MATGVQAVAAADAHVIARFEIGSVPDRASTNQTRTKVQAGSSVGVERFHPPDS